MTARNDQISDKSQHGRFPEYDKGPSLTAIPNEILLEICGYLCLHCQLQHFIDLPHTTWEEGRIGKGSLVSLSSTCRHLRDIAQPILFHYYYSGNALGSVQADFDYLVYYTDSYGKAEHIKKATHVENGSMISFLHSVVRRPHLAKSVRVLALVAHLPYYSTTLCNVPKRTLRHLQLAAFRIGLGDDDFFYSNMTSFFWLQELAIGLLPSVRHLLVRRRQQEEYRFLQESSQSLPNLKCLAVLPTPVVDQIRRCALSSTDGLLMRACNLERLRVSDYYLTMNVPGPQPTPLPQRQTLRSLVLGSENDSLYTRGRPGHGKALIWDPRMYHIQRGEHSTAHLAFRDYSVLESLEIDQMLLDGPISGNIDDWLYVSDTYDPMTILSNLPTSLKVLRVTAVICWPVMMEVLQALARKAPAMFPILHKVETVSYYTFPDLGICPTRVCDMDSMTDRFSEIGVRFTFSYSLRNTEIPPSQPIWRLFNR